MPTVTSPEPSSNNAVGSAIAGADGTSTAWPAQATETNAKPTNTVLIPTRAALAVSPLISKGPTFSQETRAWCCKQLSKPAGP